MADPFVDVNEKSFVGEEADGTQHYQMGSVAIGNGVKSFRGDEQGIWLGAEKFADAPFSVTMEGVVTMTSGTITGYVEKVGGTYSSTSATAAKIQLLPSSSIGIVAYASNGTSVVFKVEVGGTNVGDVTIGDYAGGDGMLWDQSADTLYIKGDLVAGNIDADRITSGELDIDRIPNLTADKITSGTIDASLINVDNLNASNIVTGTLTVGTGGASRIYANRSAYNATGYYTWVGGSKIWVDSNNYMGLTSTGERFYFYTGSVLYALFQRGARASFYAGVAVNGADLTVGDAGDPQNIDCYGWGSFRGDLDMNSHNVLEVNYLHLNSVGNSGNQGWMWRYTSGGNQYLRMMLGTRQQFESHGV